MPLTCTVTAGDLDRLSVATRTGRPYGSEQFVAELEKKLDRRLFPQKRGRKRSKEADTHAPDDPQPQPNDRAAKASRG